MRGRFAIRYGIEWIVPSLIIGLGPRRSWVEVDDKEIRLHMGLAFQAAIPRRSITGTARAEDVRRPSGLPLTPHVFSGDSRASSRFMRWLKERDVPFKFESY